MLKYQTKKIWSGYQLNVWGDNILFGSPITFYHDSYSCRFEYVFIDYQCKKKELLFFLDEYLRKTTAVIQRNFLKQDLLFSQRKYLMEHKYVLELRRG